MYGLYEPIFFVSIQFQARNGWKGHKGIKKIMNPLCPMILVTHPNWVDYKGQTPVLF